MANNWIQKAVGKNPGGLHKALGIAVGKKIPKKKITAVANAGGRLGRMGRLAETLIKLSKRKK